MFRLRQIKQEPYLAAATMEIYSVSKLINPLSLRLLNGEINISVFSRRYGNVTQTEESSPNIEEF